MMHSLAVITRSLWVAIVAFLFTAAFATLLFFLRLFRVADRPGGLYDKLPVWWSRAINQAAGVQVRVHGAEQIAAGEPRIFVCNHVSWFDVFAVGQTLPRGKYVAKTELYRIPIFGFGMRALGMIEIERENRKAAFASYEKAAEKIRGGTPVVVFPEGTRGRSYQLRAFKKGPFVLAIAAGVPIVPVVVHGTIEVMRRGEWQVHPGIVDIHLLEPVPTTGYSYDERDRLLSIVRDRMAVALREHHGVADSSLPAASGKPIAPRARATG